MIWCNAFQRPLWVRGQLRISPVMSNVSCRHILSECCVFYAAKSQSLCDIECAVIILGNRTRSQIYAKKNSSLFSIKFKNEKKMFGISIFLCINRWFFVFVFIYLFITPHIENMNYNFIYFVFAFVCFSFFLRRCVGLCIYVFERCMYAPVRKRRRFTCSWQHVENFSPVDSATFSRSILLFSLQTKDRNAGKEEKRWPFI